MKTVLYLVLVCSLGCQMGEWGTSLTVDTSVTETGGHSIRFEEGETGALISDYRPVAPGKPYRAFASIRDDNTGNVDDKLVLSLTWYTSAKVSISSVDLFPEGYPSTFEAWMHIEGIFQSPANAAFVRLIAEKTEDGGNSCYMWVDHFDIQPFLTACNVMLDDYQTIATGVGETQIEFNTEEYDFSSSFDSSANEWKFVAPTSGLYSVTLTSFVTKSSAPSSGMTVYTRVKKNGNVLMYGLLGSENNYYPGPIWYSCVTRVTYLESGDILKAYLTHTDTGTLSISYIYSYFSISKVE